ncbi:hypothetical protein H9651_05080 [Microbacterium sp. Sa4CUA7]|uniref:Uncharacterized protein n=1 Tax=Microbacterium pullorum TaxID=2762236 RepID=A0ABR8S1N7_9MICO|nr:hypothetical protein [Microbacterium pullorum]MBD7956999.1 hypothetical protein [Microbacterium pullorum]
MSVLGNDVTREGIGVVFQGSVLAPALTARENVHLRARMPLVARDRIATGVADVTALIGLGEFLDRPSRTVKWEVADWSLPRPPSLRWAA